jgi:hypothetical protein
MEKQTDQDRVIRFKLPTVGKGSVLKLLVVAGLAGTGMAMMAAGLIAWVVGEHVLFVAGVVAGAIFVSAGGLGVLRWLDQPGVKQGL